MLNKFKVRYLQDKERNLPTLEKSIPLVLEPQTSADKISLKDILAGNSEQILKEISNNGAVLFRGFAIKSERDFEQAITSIKGMRCMNSYFMSELGRTLIEGTDFVFYTNKLKKTGGTLTFGGFHNENFNSTDVPRFICFFCIEKPLLGGETGLVDMAKVYEDLNQDLRNKLEPKTFHSHSWGATSISERYSISVDKIKEICSVFGLASETLPSGEDIILLYKPSLIENPDNNKTAFISNFTLEIPGLHSYLNNLFRQDYKGWKWIYHKLAWKHSFLIWLSKVKLKTLPRRIKLAILKRLHKPNNKVSRKASQAQRTPEKIATAFNREEMKLLAESMHKHFSSFTWKKGDILIVDNLQLAHGGMPGFGSRVIRALLCNPIKIDLSPNSSGRQAAKENIDHKPLSEILEAFSGNKESLSSFTKEGQLM